MIQASEGHGMACKEGESNTRKQGENQNVTEEWKGGGVWRARVHTYKLRFMLACLFFLFPEEETIGNRDNDMQDLINI